jgi:hypothetical protein
MTTTINASPTNGLVQTADGSGVLKVQSNGKTTNALAWVNFNGTGTVAIRSSYNVSSITDNGTGDYTVNFTTALSDANYAASVTAADSVTFGSTVVFAGYPMTFTTTTVRLRVGYSGAGAVLTANDYTNINVAIFGN